LTPPKRFRVVVVGEPSTCFRLCVSFVEGRVVSDKENPREDSMSGLPRDEWLTKLTVDLEGESVPIELTVEIHGPWVWDLYNVIAPREYFRRFAGIVMVADLSRDDSLRDLVRFVQSFDSYTAGGAPAVLVYDQSRHYGKRELDLATRAFWPRSVGILAVDFVTGEAAARPFQWIAAKVVEENQDNSPGVDDAQ
jgi:hypothetical protein